MKEFIADDDDIPPYAILSHTLGDEEVTYRDWQNLHFTEVEAMLGCAKILGCQGRSRIDLG